MSEFSTTAAKQYLQWDRDKFVARITTLEADLARAMLALGAWERVAELYADDEGFSVITARRLTAEAVKGEKP